MKKFLLVLLLLSATLPLLVLADTPPPPTTPPTTTDDDGVAFVSLTNIPALEGAGNAATLPAFVNSLYKIAIGLAAVLAVLQIIRAGIMYMGGDSVTEKKEAKNLIALSIGGLVLILSPVIVFSIINPSILDLKIERLSELKTPEPPPYVPGGSVVSGGAGGGTANTCGAYVSVGTVAQATACSTLGAGYEDVVGACSLCQPAAGRKCCGTKTATNAKFGWRTWYLVPKTGGGTESRLLQSAIFSNSAACLTHASDSTKIPAGSTVDRSDGKGFVCSCATELRLQGTACTPWTSASVGGGGPTTPTPTAVKWGWRGKLSNNSTNGVATFQQGPFTTQQICQASLGEWPGQHNYSSTGEYECNCNTDLSKQTGCAAKFNL